MQKISKHIKETGEIARLFFEAILKKSKHKKGATVVALSGDLGAGKTAFTQYVAKHLGVTSKITSPTFVILKKYPIKKSKHYTFLIHIDAYRLTHEEDLSPLKWNELISDNKHIIFIEWPENVAKAIPPDATRVTISHMKDGHRKLELQ